MGSRIIFKMKNLCFKILSWHAGPFRNQRKEIQAPFCRLGKTRAMAWSWLNLPHAGILPVPMAVETAGIFVARLEFVFRNLQTLFFFFLSI